MNILDSTSSKLGHILSSSKNSLVISTIDFDLQLFRFSSWDWFEPITFIIDSQPDISFINTSNQSGQTPLISSIVSGDLDKALFLLSSGADPNLDSEGTTPLMYALKSSFYSISHELVDHLLKYKADPNQSDIFGNSMLLFRQ